jgi:hypothetical protein
MKQPCVTTAFTAAALLLSSSAMALRDEVPATSKPESAVPRSDRDWRRLQTRARTPEEFRALSKWCDSKAGAALKKQSEAETDLREFYANQCCSNPVKQRPRRDELLKNNIESYKRDAKRWSDLAERYSSKARALEAAPAQK